MPWLRPRDMVVVMFAGGGNLALALEPSVGRGIEGWMTKTNRDKRRGSCFVTHLTGLPLAGSPLVYLHPQNLCRATTNRSHPSGKGRGWSAGFRASVLAKGVGDRAHTPQKRGGATFQVVACS